MPARVLAICGCTCSGKTTLARRLKEEVELQGHPRVLHLQQDDFYKAEALVPRVPHAQDPQVQFPDFDSEHSLDIPALLDALQLAIAEHDLVLLEGNLLTLLPQVCQRVDRLLFLRLDLDECRRRREQRTDYVPADLPGYFDQVVRPAYERTLEKAREFEAKLRFVDADHQLLFQHSLTEMFDLLGTHVRLSSEPLDELSLLSWVRADECGALSLFLGTTRDSFEGRRVVRLEYEAHEPMAYRQLYRICAQARRKWPGLQRVAVEHRLGECPVGQSSVGIACAAPHRQDALRATEHIIDALKASVPIWKKEMYADGAGSWKANAESIVPTNGEVNFINKKQ